MENSKIIEEIKKDFNKSIGKIARNLTDIDKIKVYLNNYNKIDNFFSDVSEFNYNKLFDESIFFKKTNENKTIYSQYNFKENLNLSIIKTLKNKYFTTIFNEGELDYQEYVSLLKLYAFGLSSKFTKNGVTSSQIRNVFNEIKKAYQNSKNLKFDNPNDSDKENIKKLDEELITLEKLQIKYVYIMGKNPQNKELKNFMELLESLTKQIRSNDKNKTKENIIKFYEFVEGILAYLKYFGDSDK